MSLYMRAVLREWHEPPFGDLVAHAEARGGFRVRSIDGRDWIAFEVDRPDGVTVLAGDLWLGQDVAIVGLQILVSLGEEESPA